MASAFWALTRRPSPNVYLGIYYFGRLSNLPPRPGGRDSASWPHYESEIATCVFCKKRVVAMTIELKAVAKTAIIVFFFSVAIVAGGPTASVQSAATPAIAGTPVQAEMPATAAKLKPIKERFLLSHSSSVYKQPDKTSAIVAHVRRRTHVNVTGVIGDWLQVRLSTGKTGYIPSSAAE